MFYICSLVIDEEVDELEVAKKVNHVTGGIGYIVNNHFYDKL